uniref:PHD-type domain-containing protein n=1 Tax=Biomphalaria glabrata TaxID=6526 RepID=A0A2C9JU55_BIOGL
MSKKVKEMIGGCCVCSDERGWNENPLVYCDGTGCTVAVHQACYGIVQVPTGPWFCKKCESQERVARVKCELCPQRAGALKRTDTGGWCHVVCALYIPEAWFGNVRTMEPIILNNVPNDRFNKTCYICEEQKRDTKATAGACMQCNRNSCKQYFHVTCAQAQGLLCEVKGSYENVKYCGYCSHHYKKLKNHSNVKPIPAFKPVPNENGTPDSSPEKIGSIKTDDVKLPMEEVKSPQVDQSVSSTSDSLPSQATTYCKTEAATVSAAVSQVSDISSAVSPSGEPIKSLLPSTDCSQEPSSSGHVLQHKPTLSKLLQDCGATSSTETLEVDVGEDTTLTQETQVVPKRQRSINNSQKTDKSKKTKPGAISSTVQHKKEGTKKGGRKQRDLGGGGGSGGVSSKNSSTPVAPVTSSAPLPGHHDYCGSIFGGSPYFQSLTSPGRVSLNSLTPHAMSPSFMGDTYYYCSDVYHDNDVNGSSHLIHPPKQFPSLHVNKQSQDQSQEFPLSMEQLLEQQWDQGAQFLMEQGQHFDISSLLNCLHRLKAENHSLEDQVRELTSRRNHLMAVNARLTLPLSLYDGCMSTSQSSSVGSLEDISSPEEIQTSKPNSMPVLPQGQIPKNSQLIVEDIISPVDADPPSLSRKSPICYTDQVCPPQPLMYSVVNPPPPSLCIFSAPHHTVSPTSVSPATEQQVKMPNLSGLSITSSSSKLPETT